MDANCFRSMAPDSYFINVGRGKTVDEFALINALQSGKLQGAGLDVVAEEPLSNTSPLWEMNKVVITPHIGAQSADRVVRTIELFCENLIRFRKQERLINQVEKQLGFPLPEDRLRLDLFDRSELVNS